MILCIESTTGVCSAGLVTEKKVVAIRKSGDVREHSKLLAGYINSLLTEEGSEASSLEAVAVSGGPGSYTGLRIGVSLAKGIAYGSSIPLIATDTLHTLWYSLCTEQPEYKVTKAKRHFIPMIDARRMEVFCSIIGNDGSPLSKPEAIVVDENAFQPLLAQGEVIFFGNGAAKCREIITHPNAIFADNIQCSAAEMRMPAYRALKERDFVDVAYYEPFYLKEFVATTPKKIFP